MDVMPSMLDLAGLPVFDHNKKSEPALQGRSLRPLVLRYHTYATLAV